MPDLRFQSQPPRHTEIPRAKRGEGQWALGYREPLNANEQAKKDDNPLNVRARIETSTPTAASPRSTLPTCATGSAGGASTPSAARASTAAAPRSSSRTSSTTSTSCCASASTAASSRPSSCAPSARPRREFARDSADITDRQNIQLHWIRVEDVPEIWSRLEGVGLDTQEACGDAPRVVLGSPLAGIAADELIDPTAVDEIHRRYIGDPSFSNLPRKFKTAITGHPTLDVAPEVNDVAFVATVHPEHGVGFDVWVGGGLSTNPMLAQSLGVWVPLDEVPDVWYGVISRLPRLRLPPAALARTAEVPRRRLGHRAVPRGPRAGVPRPRAGRRRPAGQAGRSPATTSACTTRPTDASTSACRRPSVGSPERR